MRADAKTALRHRPKPFIIAASSISYAIGLVLAQAVSLATSDSLARRNTEILSTRKFWRIIIETLYMDQQWQQHDELNIDALLRFTAQGSFVSIVLRSLLARLAATNPLLII